MCSECFTYCGTKQKNIIVYSLTTFHRNDENTQANNLQYVRLQSVLYSLNLILGIHIRDLTHLIDGMVLIYLWCHHSVPLRTYYINTDEDYTIALTKNKNKTNRKELLWLHRL